MKQRLLWLDMAKGLAIALVVLGHCLSDHTWLRAFIYSFHMPLFFVLSGFTMRAKPRREVLASSLRRLMLPYALVCAILFFFAFVPPDSINPDLDSQRSWDVVLGEIFFASGQEGVFFGYSYEAIGAIWFLPCLFFARLAFNELLLLAERFRSGIANRRAARFAYWAALAALVLLVLQAGILLGRWTRLPMDLDTACIAVFFMAAGYALKRFGIERVSGVAWLALLALWMLYAQVGSNEMATRAYLEHPGSLLTGAAGALVVMRCCVSFEQLGADVRRLPGRIGAGFNRALAWAGVASLSILCVHRVESAVFNWQKIMETFAPDVWYWTLVQQGLYQFALRFTLVVALTWLLQRAVRALSALPARNRRS